MNWAIRGSETINCWNSCHDELRRLPPSWKRISVLNHLDRDALKAKT